MLNVFFSTPYPPYQSFPTTYWAKLCFVLLNAKLSNLPAVIPTIRSFFFLAFCKMQPTNWTDQRADASTQKARNTPILFFFKVPIQKKTFFHVPNVGCLGDLRQGWVEGETDGFFYGPTPSIFMPMVFSIIPPNGERKINGKKERKKTRNIFPSSKAFDWKHIFLAFFLLCKQPFVEASQVFLWGFRRNSSILVVEWYSKKKRQKHEFFIKRAQSFSFRPPFSGYRTVSMAAFLDQPGVRYMGSNPHLNTCTPGQSAAATGLIKWIKLSQAELNMFYPLVEAKAPHPACAWF